MKNYNDDLYSCFESLLMCPRASDSETSEQFIERVVEDYMLKLLELGHIPAPHLECLRSDLCAEVVDMLRSKIYGFYNLADFRRAHRGHNKRLPS